MSRPKTTRIRVTVELFGWARSAAGTSEVEVFIPAESASADLAGALASAVPELKGVAVVDDGSDLMPSYTANVSGLQFITDTPTVIRRGDTIFLFSSQAGG